MPRTMKANVSLRKGMFFASVSITLIPSLGALTNIMYLHECYEMLSYTVCNLAKPTAIETVKKSFLNMD
uniref:Uncharacterized protein n=1 Tax=Anopheles darlingi TaxID=43151 RepID=A0A2M4DG14_ANODA